MRSTFKKVSAMILAVLMVVTMASLLVVSAEVKNGARKLGSVESLTLGTSAQYSTLGTSKNGVFFADAIAVWGFNGITSYAPLSNQNGIDIFVEVVQSMTPDTRVWSDPEPEYWTRQVPGPDPISYTAPWGWNPNGPTTQTIQLPPPGPAGDQTWTYHAAVPAQVISGSAPMPSVYTAKNIYIDLGAWATPTSSAKWAKYGTKTITIGINAKYDETTKQLTWAAVPATGANPDDMLQFFSFQVDAADQQIQLFKTDLASQITATTGDNGIWNVKFQECTKQTADNQASTATTAPGYVKNMDAEQALWFDMFYGTHAYTKLFGYDFGLNGQTSYNTDKTNANVDLVLTAGTLVTTQWDIAAGAYKTSAAVNVKGTSLDLSLVKLTLPGTAKEDAYNKAAYDFFLATQGAGKDFTVSKADPRIGTTTMVPSDATVTYAYAGLKGYLRLTWTTDNAISGLQTASASGGENGSGLDGRLVGNQTQVRTAAEIEAGELLYWEYINFTSNYQRFGETTNYPANQNAYADIIYKTTRKAETTWSFDKKITDLTADMNLVDATTPGKVDLQLVPTIGGADLIAGLAKADKSNKKLRDYGFTLNYYVDYTNDYMSQLTLDIRDKTLADITTAYGKANFVVKVAKGAIVSAFECTITQYDETFVIPLQDGTFTLLRIKVRTNYDDKVSPLALADITDFNYSRLTFVEQIKFYGDRLVNAAGERMYSGNANKVLYIDMINAIPGSTDSYWIYDKTVGTFKANGYNGVQYYTKLTALLSYVGFNADGSKPVRNPVGYSKFYNTIDTSVSLTAKQLWDTSFRMVYTKGTGDAQETITEVFFPLTPAQTLSYAAADGHTYVYSVFFHTQYGDMPVAATSLGVAQKSDAKITAMGEYTYVIGTTGKDTGNGFSVGTVTKTEKKGTITVTNYWDNTRGMATTGSGISNYNKAITTLAVRIPAGATLTVSGTGNGVEAKVVGLRYGTLGVNTVDGLVDAYVTIEYSTVNDTTFTLTVNYNDGPNDGVKGLVGFSRSWDVKSTWVVRTDANPDTTNAASKAYNAFTSRFGTAKTLTPAAAVMPSNPNEAQVKSSTPSAAPVSTAPSDTSTPDMGNPFNAIAYIITIGASAIGGISTLVIRKRK